MRAQVQGTDVTGHARGGIRLAPGGTRPALVALLAVVLAAGLIGYAVAHRRAATDAGGGEPAGAQAPRTVTLKAGDDLQRALDAARPGDTLVLQAGATFVGPLTLPRKGGGEYVTVRSSALERLPPEGARVRPSDAASMPKIVSPGRGEPA
ncbi:MAG TPA: hypothetical protein VF611_05200, partial [Pyrinomonadaceae bacterium]